MPYALPSEKTLQLGEKALPLFQSGVPVGEIAVRLHVRPGNVRSALRHKGIAFRPAKTHCKRSHVLAEVGMRKINHGRGGLLMQCEACYQLSLSKKRVEYAKDKAKARRPKLCRNGHPTSKYWGLRGCRMCQSVRMTRGSKEVPRMLTWNDYAAAVDRDFAKPHWLKEAPAIKEWLVRNKIRN